MDNMVLRIRNLLFLCIACCFAMQVCAQSDPVLLRIDNEEVTRSEFEYIYNNGSPAVYDKQKITEFLSRFVEDKLKITEAKKKGLDRKPEFQSKIAEYSKTLQPCSAIEERMQEILQRDEMLEEQFLVMQIFKYIPQNSSNIEQEKVIQQMNLLYVDLKSNPQVDFAAYVETYSEDKKCFWVSPMEMGLEFEHVVFPMQKGDISAPFLTPQGIHVVKLLDKKGTDSDADRRTTSLLRLKRKYRNEGDALFLQQLKEKYNFVSNREGVNELLTSGNTEKTLFSLDGKTYSGSDFRYFAESNPQRVQRQFDDFVTKALIDSEKKREVVKHPEYDLLIEKYKDMLLSSEITRQEIGDKARNDQTGLAAYFSVHKKDYRWDHPRFEGFVLHARSKKIISEAKKLVKKKPVSEWEDMIVAHFNSGPVQQVQVERNGVVHSSSYPYTVVLGKKLKGPESYKEVLDNLIPDYEKFLEKLWMKQLYETYRVEINEEVLKTVNNH